MLLNKFVCVWNGYNSREIYNQFEPKQTGIMEREFAYVTMNNKRLERGAIDCKLIEITPVWLTK